MPARKPAVSAARRLYEQYIARLRKIGCTWCAPCYAWMAPTHSCDAFKPVYLPAPLEAYTFAADRDVA